MENEKKLEKYLPIGTVVLLKKGKIKLMINGYCMMEGNDESKVYDYVGCIYPFGMLGSDKNFLFNHDQIDKIYFIGYSDQEQVDFIKGLKETVAKNDQEQLGDIASLSTEVE